MKLLAIVFFNLVFFSTHVSAKVDIEKHLYQNGMFYELGVDGKPLDMCIAKVYNPVVNGGVSEDLKLKLNNFFRFYTDKIKCEGVLMVGRQAQELINNEGYGIVRKSVLADFIIANNDNKILSMLLSKTVDNGDGKPLTHFEGINYDLVKNRPIRLVDIIDPIYINDVKLAVYDQMREKAGVTEEPKDFLASSDCEGCTFVISSQGLKIIFQPYILEKMGGQRAEFEIPGKYIRDDYIGLVISGAVR